MSEDNICRFIPQRREFDEIHTIEFVLETKPQSFDKLKNNSVYRMHYILEGVGRLHMPGRVCPLQKGDLFFTSPGMPSAIESIDNLKYMYISYLGTRANMIMEQLQISSQNCIFHDCKEIEAFWKSSIQATLAMYDLRTESVLLYTFSVLGTKIIKETEKVKKTETAVALVKKYIDEHYTNPDLSLEMIGSALSYNKKYVSKIFKETYHVGVAEYLNVIRIQHACTLMEQGFTSIHDIAASCGFRDPLYFSRVFRKRMDISPKEHIEFLKKKRN